MRFRAAALLAALVLVSACDGRLKIPDERPDISSPPPSPAGFAAVLHSRLSCQEWDCGDGSAVIASRQMLRGKSSKAQHLSEAMLMAIASFAFPGAAVLAIVSGGEGGIGKSGDQGSGGTGSNGGGGGRGGGGKPNQRRGCFPGTARIIKPPFDEHCIVIFGLMAEGGVYTETATRSTRAIAKWQSIFDQYFKPISGAGRAWTMRTNPCDALNKRWKR